MDLSLFPDMTADQHQAIQAYLDNQVKEKLADARHAQQEAVAPEPQADEEWRGAQPEEQGSRGSSNLPTDQRVEGLTKVFEALQGKEEKQHQSTAAAIATTAAPTTAASSRPCPDLVSLTFSRTMYASPARTASPNGSIGATGRD